MTQTASAASLLHAACQDLHAGKRLQVERLPKIADAAGEALAQLIRDETARAEAQARRIEAAGVDTAGPRNLWMAGVLDDAERDSRSHQAGRLRDIALVGALRKGKAAEIVSGDTALALAAETGDAGLAEVVAANRAEEIATDRALATLLGELTGEMRQAATHSH
jgi:ferritin-like metal-binding protein YciE